VPRVLKAKGEGEQVRVWSAGCAGGQEIYSLAMLQAEAPAPTGRVELFASDLSTRLLEQAQRGIYTSFEAQRGLTARRLVRHFQNRGQDFQLARPLRQQVRWRRVNLIEDLSPLGRFDVVLCRYVLGALTAEARGRVLQQLLGVVAQGGVLLLGLEETPDTGGFAPLPGLAGAFVRRAEAAQEAA